MHKTKKQKSEKRRLREIRTLPPIRLDDVSLARVCGGVHKGDLYQ